ncbi:MAG: IS200/IS605 family transposase [Nonlabens sp.]
MSRNNIHAYYHIVFSTKQREPMITTQMQSSLYKMLWNKCIEIGCDPIMINGMEDHVHILMHANPLVSISKTLKDIKGSSSRWMNDNYEFLESFTWQRGYGLFTVSPEEVPKIASYIQNQKSHHANKSVIDDFEI